MKFQAKPVRTVSPVIRQLCTIAESDGLSQAGLGRKAGTAANTISTWRSGYRSPTLINFENVAQALGYRLKLVKIKERK